MASTSKCQSKQFILCGTTVTYCRTFTCQPQTFKEGDLETSTFTSGAVWPVKQRQAWLLVVKWGGLLITNFVDTIRNPLPYCCSSSSRHDAKELTIPPSLGHLHTINEFWCPI
ncbi:hypothetical protein J6590_073432 [Homalodisca vitripennis]|nr:hypothetical protein J6590_073432 [Homalodisca vitripennis]